MLYIAILQHKRLASFAFIDTSDTQICSFIEYRNLENLLIACRRKLIGGVSSHGGSKRSKKYFREEK